MLTKVSYNAYASSANAMQRPNQEQNVNFGMRWFTSKPKKLSKLVQFRDSFLPSYKVNHDNTFIGAFNLCAARLEAFWDFLNFCRSNPEANLSDIASEVFKLPSLKQDNPTVAETGTRLKTLLSIVDFCKENNILTAKKFFDGVTEGMPIDQIEAHLKDTKGIAVLSSKA